MPSPLDPRRLLTFREVARRGSFSRAADALDLSQPAVSQQVAGLERTVGAPLLHRGAGGVRPTQAGELLLAHADAIADRLELAGAQLAEAAQEVRHRLRLGAFPSALAALVPDAIRRLRRDNAGVMVDVTEAGNEQLLRLVGRGELHLAVLFDRADAPPRDLGGLRRDELLEEPFVAVVAERHRLARRRMIAVADLAAEPWTAPSREGLVSDAVRATGREPDIPYVTSDPLAMARLVGAGLAVTLTPRMGAVGLPGVAVVDVRDAPRRRVYAVTPARGRHPLAGPLVAALRG